MSTLTDRIYLLEYKEKMKEKEMAERQKQIKSIQQKKEQEKEFKEYEKGLILACKRELKERFEIEFRNQGVKAKYYFYNVENRDAIIKGIAKSELEGDFLEDNYNKILNNTIKKYELQRQYQDEQLRENAIEYAEKMRPIWEKEAKKEKVKNTTENALLMLFGHPFILLFLVIIGIIMSIFINALGFSFFPALGMSLIVIFVLIIGFLGFI